MVETTIPNRNRRVLIVEDDSDDVLLLNRALRAVCKISGIGLDLSHAKNGFEALSAVALCDMTSRLPDVVVVDLNMPIMSGESFLRRLRADLGLERLPAIVLTTSNDKPIHAAAISSGANCVLVKPNSFADLLAIANKVIVVATEGSRSHH